MSAPVVRRNRRVFSGMGDCQRPAGQRRLRTDYEPKGPCDVTIMGSWLEPGYKVCPDRKIGWRVQGGLSNLLHLRVGSRWFGRTKKLVGAHQIVLCSALSCVSSWTLCLPRAPRYVSELPKLPIPTRYVAPPKTMYFVRPREQLAWRKPRTRERRLPGAVGTKRGWTGPPHPPSAG